MADLVAINGEIFKPEDARISVFDRGFLYGDGVYEVTRSYGRVLFALEDHIERLYRSADRIGLDIGMTREELSTELYRIHDAAQRPDRYIRVVVTRGEGKINLDPTTRLQSNIVVFVQDVPAFDPKLYETGQDIITASILRNPKKSLDPNVKSGNYLNNILALGEAKKRKAHDAVMVSAQGHVTEGTTWNIYMVQDGAYVSTPDDGDILQGITRKIIRDIIKSNGMKWVERFFTPDEMKKAPEVLSTSSIREVMGIRTVDDVTIGNGRPGPATLKLAQLYKEYVTRYCKERAR
jgi:branched-chain amino acid aminotransferase